MQPAEIDSFAYLCQALTLVGSQEALLVLNPSTVNSLNIASSVVTPTTKPLVLRLTPLFRFWTCQTSTIMQYSTGIYVGISTEKIVGRQS